MSVPRPAMLVAMVTAPGHAGLGDDEGLLLVVAGVEDGEDLLLDAVLAEERGERRGSEKSRCCQPRLRSSSARSSDFSIEVVPTRIGWPRFLQSSMRVRIALYFSSAVR